MAFLDAFKRWRLAQRGLSSGRKRRVFAENTVVAILERSVWIRWGLFVLFALGTAVLVDLIGSDHKTGQSVLFGLVVASTAIMIVESNYDSICHRNGRVFLVLGGLAFHVGVVITISMLVDGYGLPSQWKFLMIPFALTPMVHAVLLGRGIGIFSTIYATLLGALVIGKSDVLVYMSVCLVCGLITVLTVHQVRKRVQLLRAGVYAGAAALFLAIAFGEIDLVTCFQSGFSNCRETLVSCALALLTGIVTALLVSGLLPVLESMFQLTTDISWLEHSDLNHKLLRRLQLEAPGTFHHSLIVASLAEAAAEKVGANAPMCRVCAYFHDIGKLTKPEYFIENQHPGAENPHDSLTPTMSALIIIAHVKDGIDLAVKHKLNPKVIEVIQEHHGDSLVSFFYRRAQEQKKAELEKVEKGLGNPEDLPKIDEKNFRYPGPRPRSRESGILSLADAVESASRTLKKPTPAKIRSLVEDIVEARICDGQLDDCQLTICDLKHVQESFSNTLRSMMHSRIDYPKEEGAKRSANQNPEGLITSTAPTKSASVQPPAPIAATTSHHPA